MKILHPRLIAYNLRWEGSIKVIKANNSKLYGLNQSLRQWAECGDKTFWEVVRNLGSGFLLLSKTLLRDPLFRLLSCENQITSMHFHFFIYKMRKWTRWPGKVLLVLISIVLWKYRNFGKTWNMSFPNYSSWASFFRKLEMLKITQPAGRKKCHHIITFGRDEEDRKTCPMTVWTFPPPKWGRLKGQFSPISGTQFPQALSNTSTLCSPSVLSALSETVLQGAGQVLRSCLRYVAMEASGVSILSPVWVFPVTSGKPTLFGGQREGYGLGLTITECIRCHLKK